MATPTQTPKRLSRQEAQARTRALLLDAARALFIERGFHGTSVEEIAERAGFTRGAFYSNFESKDDVFLAVLDAHSAADIAEITELMSRAESLDDAFFLLRHRNDEREMSPWTMLFTEFWLYAMRNPGVRPKLAERMRAERKAFARAIRAQFRPTGFEPPTSVDDIALVIQSVDTGIQIYQQLDPQIRKGVFFDATALLFEAGLALSRERGLRSTSRVPAKRSKKAR